MAGCGEKAGADRIPSGGIPVSRARRIWIIAGTILGLLLASAVAVVFVLQSTWFHEQVRAHIVAEAEKATGGRVEIGSFEYDWPAWTVRLNHLAIHGTEPAGAAPLLRARSLTVVLKVVSFFERIVDVQSVDIEQPEANLLIDAEGNTNVPRPKTRASDKTAVETILDLAIARFTVTNGTIQINSQKNPWNAAGENLRARFVYGGRNPSYRGDISTQPLHLTISENLPVDLGIKASVILEKNKLTIPGARLETPSSSVEISGAVQGFASPQSSLEFSASLSLDEVVRTLRLASRARGMVQAAGEIDFRDFGHYLLTGSLRGRDLSLRQGKLQLQDVGAQSTFRMDPAKIELSGLRLSTREGNFNGNAVIEGFNRFRANGEASQLDARHLAGLYGSRNLPWDTLLSGPVEVSGRLSDLYRGLVRARLRLDLSPAPGSAPVRGLIDAEYDGFRDTISLGNSFIQLPASRLDFSGTLERQLRVRFHSTNLDDVLPALEAGASHARQELPLKLDHGSAAFDGTVTGSLTSPQIAGHVALSSFLFSQEKIEAFRADIRAQAAGLVIKDGSVTRGELHGRFDASVPLRDWRPDDAGPLSVTASLRGANVSDLLALAGQQDFPATGRLSASAEITGTIGSPLIKAGLTAVNGSLYGEPFDRVTARAVSSANGQATAVNAEVAAGARQSSIVATYTHAAGDFAQGSLAFQVSTNAMPLAQFHLVQQYQPTLNGDVQVKASGSVAVSKDRAGHAAFHLTALNADATGRGIEVDQKSIGEVRLTSKTQGAALTAHFESSIANANIRADGKWELTGDYPGSAEIALTKVDLGLLQSWLSKPPLPFQVAGSVAGKLAISGPAFQPEAWTGAVEIPELEITPLPRDAAGGNAKTISLHNSDPIRLALANSVLRVERARLVGEATDLAFTGTISPKARSPLDLRVNGTLDLAVLQDFNSDLVSSGRVLTEAAIRGPFTQPLINGRMELQNANLSLATFPNGLSNANGVIVFSGDRASIQSLTGESGGGKISATGFVSNAGGRIAFRIEATAREVRIRYPEGASTVANARFTWTGGMERSLVSGTVRVLRTSFNPRTDFASILAQSSQPVRTPAATTGLLAGTQFDVQVESAPDLLVQSALAQQLQAEANLRLRGTATNPVLLGRINITQGQMTFFGNQYTIQQGSVSFFNAVKLEPVLNIDLGTKARGIDVTITISGPLNKLNVSYRSDPPMQFSDIVALLATGRAPSTDLSAAARQSGAVMSWQQVGASAIVGEALANPVSGRLQRFFGISRIKIDPTLTGLENPQARLTIEQQVTPDITFTYITNVNQANPQVIRVEWAVNRQWSVVAVRDENGIFGMDFYYKKRFK